MVAWRHVNADHIHGLLRSSRAKPQDAQTHACKHRTRAHDNTHARRGTHARVHANTKTAHTRTMTRTCVTTRTRIQLHSRQPTRRTRTEREVRNEREGRKRETSDTCYPHALPHLYIHTNLPHTEIPSKTTGYIHTVTHPVHKKTTSNSWQFINIFWPTWYVHN